MIEKKHGLFSTGKAINNPSLQSRLQIWLLGLVFGRCMVYSTEEQNQLSDSGWGARPGRSTKQPDLLYKTTMSYEISRLTEDQPLGTLDNDAKACHATIANCHGTCTHDMPANTWSSTTICMHDGRHRTPELGLAFTRL